MKASYRIYFTPYSISYYGFTDDIEINVEPGFLSQYVRLPEDEYTKNIYTKVLDKLFYSLIDSRDSI